MIVGARKGREKDDLRRRVECIEEQLRAIANALQQTEQQRTAEDIGRTLTTLAGVLGAIAIRNRG